MRCTDAIVSAFLAHPDYHENEHLIQRGTDFVSRGDWAFAYYLPVDSARDALTQCLPEIIKKQLSTGLWKKKYAEKISYRILRSLKHADMISGLIKDGFRYDPFKSFSEAGDFYGFLVRRNIMESMLTGDGVLQDRLISQIAENQRKDGSWDGTIVSTTFQMEYLMELGVGRDDDHIAKGAEWILSQFRETIERRRPKASWGVFYHNVFTSDDCGSEFHSALEQMPEEIPRVACFNVLAFIQTALAIRTLVNLGFGNDERILKSYASLLDVQILPEDQQNAGSDQPIGNWCGHGCRYLLEDRVKAQRKLARKRE